MMDFFIYANFTGILKDSENWINLTIHNHQQTIVLYYKNKNGELRLKNVGSLYEACENYDFFSHFNDNNVCGYVEIIYNDVKKILQLYSNIKYEHPIVLDANSGWLLVWGIVPCSDEKVNATYQSIAVFDDKLNFVRKLSFDTNKVVNIEEFKDDLYRYYNEINGSIIDGFHSIYYDYFRKNIVLVLRFCYDFLAYYDYNIVSNNLADKPFKINR